MYLSRQYLLKLKGEDEKVRNFTPSIKYFGLRYNTTLKIEKINNIEVFKR